MADSRESAKKDATEASTALRDAAQSVTSQAAGGEMAAATDEVGATGAGQRLPQEGGHVAGPLKITAISVADAARILSAAYGRRISAEMVREIAERGSLLRPDGTFNLLHYAAWLVKEMAGGD